MFGAVKSVTEGALKFVSLHGSYKANESYMPPFTNTFDENDKAEITTGQYVVIKYRIPTTNPDEITYLEIFTSTVNKTALGQGDHVSVHNNKGIYNDGNWHVLVIDVSKSGLSSVKAESDGSYKLNYIRLDVFNYTVSDETRIDFAYFAIHDSIEEICSANSDMDEITLFQNKKATQIDTSTGKPVQ